MLALRTRVTGSSILHYNRILDVQQLDVGDTVDWKWPNWDAVANYEPLKHIYEKCLQTDDQLIVVRVKVLQGCSK